VGGSLVKVLTAAFLLFAAPLCAAPITILNPGFEGNILANPGVGQKDNFIVTAGENITPVAVPNWTFGYTQMTTFSAYAGVSDLAVGNHASEGAIDNNIAWFFIQENKQLATIFARQTLSATLANNTRYTLTVRVAQSAHAEGDPLLDNPIFPTLGNGVSTGDVFARLWVNNPTTAMPGFLAAASIVSVPADDTWANWTLVWETGANEGLAGGTLGIELFNRANTIGQTLPVEVFFDDLALQAVAVPEPTTLGLFLVGSCLGCVHYRRRVAPS
jgi:hypothetical protein